MAAHDAQNEATSRATAGAATTPPVGGKRLRLPLRAISDVQRELARLYREAKRGDIAVADASRLANVLQIIARLIESSDLEDRIRRLEEAAGNK